MGTRTGVLAGQSHSKKLPYIPWGWVLCPDRSFPDENTDHSISDSCQSCPSHSPCSGSACPESSDGVRSWPDSLRKAPMSPATATIAASPAPTAWMPPRLREENVTTTNAMIAITDQVGCDQRATQLVSHAPARYPCCAAQPSAITIKLIPTAAMRMTVMTPRTICPTGDSDRNLITSSSNIFVFAS
jgi:hypothetical protein